MEKKDFRKLYEDLVKSDWFKKAYHDKSLGECPFEIPELAESEDERIRKQLVDIVAFIPEANFKSASREDCRTYLEKQKPLQTDTEKEYVRTLKSLISDFLYGKQEIDTGYYQQIYDWLDGRHIEQKTMEGKEYTSPDCGTSACCDDERFEIIAQAKRDIIEKTNIAENELSMELPLLDGILMRVWQVGWLNKKPAELSGKDEKMLNEIITIMDGGKVTSGTYLSEYVAWLKSLRPQPKAELTLLDENIINAAVAFVEQNNHFSYWGGIDKHTVIKALRSLKPHWKPSEEQMKAIEHAYNSFPNDCPTKLNLRLLYHDLKNLM